MCVSTWCPRLLVIVSVVCCTLKMDSWEDWDEVDDDSAKKLVVSWLACRLDFPRKFSLQNCREALPAQKCSLV